MAGGRGAVCGEMELCRRKEVFQVGEVFKWAVGRHSLELRRLDRD